MEVILKAGFAIPLSICSAASVMKLKTAFVKLHDSCYFDANIQKHIPTVRKSASFFHQSTNRHDVSLLIEVFKEPWIVLNLIH